MSPYRPGVQTAVPALTRLEPVEAQAYAFGHFRLLPRERIFRRNDQILPLPPKVFDTLVLLAQNPGHLMLKEDMIKKLWPDSFVEEVNLANNISLLRKVLGGQAGGDFIQTVPKRGYRFLPPVTKVWGGAPADSQTESIRERPAEHPLRFIALPFHLFHSDQRIEHLRHSLPEAISASLAGLRSMTVRSSLLAARLGEGRPDPREIAREADVDLLLAGTILREEDQLRVNAELVDAPTGSLIATYACQTALDNTLAVQDSLVRRIIESLMLPLTQREQRTLHHDVPASAKAYEYYLRANYLVRERTLENIVLARGLYLECVEEDPNFAAAWARLGRCYRFLEKFGEDGPHGLEKAQWAFRRAFSLNPDLTIAHNLYTQIEADMGNARTAMVRLLRRAETHPNDPDLFAGLVQACRFCGLPDESIAADRVVQRLDSRANTSVTHTFFLKGDYTRALESYDRSAGYYLDAAILAVTGGEKEAAELLDRRRFSGVRTGWMWSLMASLRALLAGNPEYCRQLVRQALAQPERSPEAKFYLSRHLARAGAGAEALAVLRELIDEGFLCSTALGCDPWLRHLADLPGFNDVLHAVLRRESDARAAFVDAGGSRLLA